MSDWPTTMQINAFAGAGTENSTPPGTYADGWAARIADDGPAKLMGPELPADPWDWRDPRVGWGLVLPDVEDYTAKQRAAADDAPEAIRRLLAARPDAPVLRYRERFDTTHVRRGYHDGTEEDIRLSKDNRGVGRGRLPGFLLIYAPPDVIPWRFQFLLNQVRAVGRLWLEGDALERYVDHLIGDWSASACDPGAAVVWGVDHGSSDITRLMRTTIAQPLFDLYAADEDLRERSVNLADGAIAPTGQALADALAERRPAVVVTTSHGMTGPLDDGEALRAQLGVPVDCAYRPLDLQRLLGAWQPDGAIWYSHACCSAGSTARTAFGAVVDEDSPVDRILKGVALAAGERIAPLPQALLGAAKPARAFVGHVEPTFDWTIRDPMAGHPLTGSTMTALYELLYQPRPLGHAFGPWFEDVGVLFGQRDLAREKYNEGTGTLAVAGLTQLAALDRRSMVIIGDPTVALPPLPGGPPPP